LFLNSFWRLRQVDPGFDAHNVLTFRMSLPYDSYQPAQVAEFYRQLQTRLQAIPGVRAASTVMPLPLSSESSFPVAFDIEGCPLARSERPACELRLAQTGYFRTMGIRLITGRDFTERDDAKATPVAIINETLARRFFPNEDPISKRIKPEFAMARDTEPAMREIIGVVGDVKRRSLSDDARPEIYAPHAQLPYYEMYVTVKTETDPRRVVSAVRAELRALDKDQPIYDVRTLEQRLGASLAQQRFSALLLTLFAGIALVLTAVGLYGVMSYSVTQRTHEIGIRLALGAQPRDIFKLVVGQGMRLTLFGVGIGLVGAFGLTRFLSSLLFGVKPTDPVIFASVSLLLTGVALFASYIPARRATKVDPMVALRYE